MTASDRALIAEARKHDEAMTDGPWYGRSRFVSRVPDNTGMGATMHTNHVANAANAEDARGIAWLRTNIGALIAGYELALDENAELHETQDRLVARIAATDSPADIDETLAAYADVRDTVTTLRAEVERMRAALVKIHDDAVYDNNHERYLDIAGIFDGRKP